MMMMMILMTMRDPMMITNRCLPKKMMTMMMATDLMDLMSSWTLATWTIPLELPSVQLPSLAVDLERNQLEESRPGEPTIYH